MSTNKHIDKICVVVLVVAILITVLFMNGEAFGLKQAHRVLGYENRLFDTSKVHTIDIVMDDWDDFIETCENEEYEVCSVIIDGEAFKNVGIRAKGNTSLSNVSQMDSDRYSFKIEFDHYDNTESYYGLDKLSLNNIIQDNTYMKDYLAYTMMNYAGAAAPLCSYAYITVNGEDFGLYLAVESIEDSFLKRNYGNDYGELYKPDSMSFGGGRGNGGRFDMDSFMEDNPDLFEQRQEELEDGGFTPPERDFNASGGAFAPPGDLQMPQNQPPDMGQGGMMQSPSGAGLQMPEGNSGESFEKPEMPGSGRGGQGGNRDGFGGGMGMGSDDVKLKYIDDNPDSYANIFDNAKTDISDADKARLIESLKALSEYVGANVSESSETNTASESASNEKSTNIERIVDTEAVIKYFTVHNFLCNGDSYTGSMIHNYYLYEEDGALSMLPWDYNLAFGGFDSARDATTIVNSPIDSPVSGGDATDRPMALWIFESEEYTKMYHESLDKFIAEYFESGYFEELIDSTEKMIAPYVKKDPTKFCTYEEFETAVDTLKEFCMLRAESVRGQLDGTIPSTSEGQAQDTSSLIDASYITISNMGSMNTGRMGGEGMMPGNAPRNTKPFETEKL